MFFKGEIPFVRLLFPLIAGIAAGWILPRPEAAACSPIIVICLFLLFTLLLIFYRRNLVYRRRWLAGVVLHLLVAVCGYYLTTDRSERYQPDYFTNIEADALIIRIANEPKLTGDILRFEADVRQSMRQNSCKPASGKLLVALKTDSLQILDLTYGDELIIPAIYNEVEPPYNPGEFDFKDYLKTRQLYDQSFINRQEVRLLARSRGNPVIAYALGLRKTLVYKFERYLPDQSSASLASALILGYRADLSKEIISAYSKTGAMHVLSVSGMHVGIVFLVLNFLLKPLGSSRKGRLLRALIIIGVIWYYSLLTGFSASVCRAALMLSFIVTGKALNKSLNTYNLLAISACMLLMYNPFFLFDVGFQLSYLAVIGLVYLHPKIYNAITIKNPLLDAAWSYSALSFAAQVATFPISIYYFHQFPVYFLISNLVIVLPVALIMYGGILFLLIPFGMLLEPLGQAVGWLIQFTNALLFRIENLPFSTVADIWIDAWQYVLIYAITGCIVWALQSRSRAAVRWAMAATLVLTAGIAYQNIISYRQTKLIVYSLRKNSVIAYLDHGRVALISDLPGSDKTLQFSVLPALSKFGCPHYQLYTYRTTQDDEDVDGNYMQFAWYSLLRWDKRFDTLVFTKQVHADALLLSGNPAVQVDELKKQVKFSILLIDGTNPDYKIRRWMEQARRCHVPCHVLKKNAAYLVDL